VVERQITIKNRLGLHARPASLVAKKASTFKSEVRLKKDDLEINAKSIMGVMILAAECGSRLTIKAWGEDEARAVQEIADLFESKFGEE
jgi:phosphocarrier protein